MCLTRRQIIRARGRGKGKPFNREEKYRVNGRIVAPEVRLIDETGEMVGVLSSQDALRMAEDKGLDLIEIAPNAKPPTCKIMDYGKWKYENKKKAVASRKKQVVVSIKEIQLRVRIEQHDLGVKTRNARKFLLAGDKVKINLRFYGREMAHQELGAKLLNTVAASLGDVSAVEAPPKREGRQLFVLLIPDPAKIKDYQQAQKHRAKEVAKAAKSAESEVGGASAEPVEVKKDISEEAAT